MRNLLCAALLAMSLLPVIVESPVYAEVVADAQVFSTKTLRKAVGNVARGDAVEILEDFSLLVYRVAAADGVQGWIAAKNLRIPPNATTDTSVVSQKDLENFVNSAGYESKTPYLVVVDIARQKVYIFNGAAGSWAYTATFDCATGENVSPTTRGVFTFTDRGDWFFSHRLQSGAKYWIRFNGAYLFHSIAMDKGKKPIPGEDRVGTRQSSGCVRLLVPDAKWIYDNVPDGTTVVIL